MYYLYATKLVNLKQIDKFPDSAKLPILNQEELNDLNISITNEIEIIKMPSR